MLLNRVASDPEGQARLKAFQQGLEQKGWSDGRLNVDVRWGEDDAERERQYAKELLALAPDAVLAGGSLGVAAFQQFTHTVPIVFASVADPVGGGFVDNLAHPGGNTTGFMLFEYSLSGKWVELLKQIAPSVTRAGVLRVTNTAGTAEFAAVQATAQSLGIEVSPISVRETYDIERALTSFARIPNGGLILTPSASASAHRDLIIALAARFKLPAVYVYRFDVTGGGLISYGPDATDQYQRAAVYVDRILRGEKVGDLPVQAPTKYLLVINLKTAKALGLNVPQALLAGADEVIE